MIDRLTGKTDNDNRSKQHERLNLSKNDNDDDHLSQYAALHVSKLEQKSKYTRSNSDNISKEAEIRMLIDKIDKLDGKIASIEQNVERIRELNTVISFYKDRLSVLDNDHIVVQYKEALITKTKGFCDHCHDLVLLKCIKITRML